MNNTIVKNSNNTYKISNNVPGVYTEYLTAFKEDNSIDFNKNAEIFKEYKTASPERRKELINIIVKSNIRLVMSIVKRYYNESINMEITDLTQEGVIGLIIAIDKFDSSMGFSFSTYATHWIKQSVLRAIFTKNRMIKLPVYVEEDIIQIKAVLRKYEKDDNTMAPSVDDLIKETGLSEFRVQRALDYNDAISYDIPVSSEDGEESNLLQFISDETYNPETGLLFKDTQVNLNKLMNDCLSQREIDIVSRRFGLNENDGDKDRLQSIADDYGMSRERIRQIEASAIKKIRLHVRKKHIKRDDFC